jgi:hypothetical protein
VGATLTRNIGKGIDEDVESATQTAFALAMTAFSGNSQVAVHAWRIGSS